MIVLGGEILIFISFCANIIFIIPIGASSAFYSSGIKKWT